MKKNAIVNRLANLLAGRRNSSVSTNAQNRKKVRAFEPLEERQLLSVSNQGTEKITDIGTAIPVCSAPLDDQYNIISIADTVCENDLTASNARLDNSNQTTKTFRTSSGGNLDQYLDRYEGPIRFTINVDQVIDKSATATLTLRVYDVDYTQGESDVVSINDIMSLGKLTGANNSWSTVSFSFSASVLNQGTNTIQIDIDTTSAGWCVECDWGQITVPIIEPNLSISDIEVKNADNTIPSSWGVVAEHDTTIQVLATEISDKFSFEQYNRLNVTIKVEEYDFSDYGFTGIKSRVFEKTSIFDVQKGEFINKDFSKTNYTDHILKFELSGWTPRSYGKYNIVCSIVGYYDGGFQTKIVDDSISQQFDVGVDHYYVACANPLWENDKITDKIDYSIGSSVRNFTNRSLVVDRSWYEGTWLKISDKDKRQEFLYKELGFSSNQKLLSEMPLDSCYIVFGIGDGSGKINHEYEILSSDKYIFADSNKNSHEYGQLRINFNNQFAKLFRTESEQAEFLLKTDIHDKWKKHERAYVPSPYAEGLKDEFKYIYTDYFIENEFHTSPSGLDAYGLCTVGENVDSVLLFAGTNTDWNPIHTHDISFVDLWGTDLAEEGIGHDQYFSSQKNNIEEWAASQDTVNLYGYSLGASLSQWFLSEYTGNNVKRASLFNSPGISHEAVQKYKDRQETISVTYHIAENDLVSMAGQSYIPGTVIIHKMPYLDTSILGSTTIGGLMEYHLSPLVNKYSYGTKNHNLTSGNYIIDTETFGSYWFHYDSAWFDDHYQFLLGNNHYIRGTVETLRSQGHSLLIGTAERFLAGTMSSGIAAGLLAAGAHAAFEFLNITRSPISYTLSNGWILKDINKELDQSSGSVSIITNDNQVFDALIFYSGNTISKIQVIDDKTNNDISFIAGNMTFVDGTESIPVDIRQNSKFHLTGSMSAMFSENMANFTVTRIESGSALTGAGSEIGASIWTIGGKISVTDSYGEHEYLQINPYNSFYSIKGELRGLATVSIPLYVFGYDAEGNSYWEYKSGVFSDCNVAMTKGLLYDRIQIQSQSNNLSIIYREGSAPVMQYDGEVYSFNKYAGSHGAWIPLTHYSELSNAVVSSIDSIDESALSVSVDGNKLTLSAPSSLFENSIMTSFYLVDETVDPQGVGTYISSFTPSEFVYNEGRYCYEFDASDWNLLSGHTYSIYAIDEFLGGESTHSQPFVINDSPTETTLLETSIKTHDFVPTPVGEYQSVSFDVTNSGSHEQGFELQWTGDYNFLISVSDQTGNPLDANDLTLLPNEKLTITLYFFPTEEKNYSGTLQLIASDLDTELSVISFSGSGVPALETDVSISASDSALSSTTIQAGDELRVTCSVNNETQQVATNVSVSCYAVSPLDVDQNRIQLGTTELGYRLAGGESAELVLQIDPFPNLPMGEYNLILVVESDNDVNKANNTLSLGTPILVTTQDEEPQIHLSIDSASPIDENDNGFYDILEVVGSATVKKAGTYYISSNLTDADGIVVAHIDVQQDLTPGVNNVEYSFKGNDVFKSACNGPYTIQVSIYDDADNYFMNNSAFETGAYLYRNFNGGQASFTNAFSDYGIDVDQNGLIDSIEVSVGVQVSAESRYRVSGTLVDESGMFVAYADQEVDLSLGSSSVALSFDASKLLRDSEATFTLTNLLLYDVSVETLLETQTNAYVLQGTYTATDVDYEVRLGDSVSTSAEDSNYNNLFDKLTVTVPVKVSTDGKYIVFGTLVDANNNVVSTYSERVDFDSNSTDVTCEFDGLTIGDSRFTSPLILGNLSIITENGETVASRTYTLPSEFAYSDFEHHSIYLTEDVKDYLSEDGSYLTITFKVEVESAGSYNANARLVDKSGNTLGWDYCERYASEGGTLEFVFRYNYSDIVAQASSDVFEALDLSIYKTGSSNEYDAIFVSHFYETGSYPYKLNEPVWNLTDYPQYKSFKLDATTDSNYTATLYGLEKDGKTYTALQAWDFIGADATATLTGRNIVAENLWITEDAARLLGGVQFDGGELLLDTLQADGTAGNDDVAISTETVVVETPIYTTNPYEKCIEYYKTLYGETSKTFLTIKANYDDAYGRLSKLVTRKTSTYGVVDLNGTTLKFLGVRDVALNLGEGDDAVTVDSLHYNYAINSAGGANSLDFSEATNALNLDLGATWRQFPLVGDGGTLQLSGVYTTVEGTAKNDRIVGTKAGLNFNGIAGSDSVTLVGGVNNVELNGARQSVTARGDGEYNVAIENGAGSVVNADGVSKRGAVMVDAEGANTTIFGGLGVLNAGVRGRFAVVNAGATTRSTMFVEGANAVVTTGGGDDIVEVVGDYASVTTNGGADLVTITGADSNVHLGLGDDVLFLADGDSGRVGNHHVWADAGEDAVFAAKTAGVNYFYAGAGNDVMIGGAGSDYMYANLGNNVFFGLGGVDRLFGGTGRDVLVASTTDATARLETMTQQELAALYAELYQAWEVDDDMDATVALLGEHCVADEAKDWIYRGGGRNNLVYASQLDADFENALENVPFNDELKLD